MKILVLILTFFTINAHAQTCSVQNYQDAIDCIKADSYQRYQEGELEHSVGVTRFKKGREAFEVLTGKKSNADYVGVVEVHYDEDQLLYYEINKGDQVEPKMVKEHNLVDISYNIPQLMDLPEYKFEEFLSLFIPLVDSMEDFHADGVR